MAILYLNLAIPVDTQIGISSDASNMDAMKTIQCTAGALSIINIEISNDNESTWVVAETLHSSGIVNISVYAQFIRTNVIRPDYSVTASVIISANSIPSALITANAAVDPLDGSINIDTSTMSSDKVVYCTGDETTKIDVQVSNDSGNTWASICQIHSNEFKYISTLSGLMRAIALVSDYRSTMSFVISATTIVAGGDSAGHGGGGNGVSNSSAWFAPARFGTLNQGVPSYTYDQQSKSIIFNDVGSKSIEVGYDINLSLVDTQLNDRIVVTYDNEGGIRVGIYYVIIKGDESTQEVWKRTLDCSEAEHFVFGKAILITQEAFEVDPCSPQHESILYMCPPTNFVLDSSAVTFVADTHAVRTNSDRTIYGHWTFNDSSLNIRHTDTGISTTINSLATETRTQVLPDQNGTFAMLSDLSGFNESAFRDAANALTATVHCNYQRFNSVGHPHPTWPHGVGTVGWIQANFLPMLNVTDAPSGTFTPLSQVSPWQGVIAIDSTDPSLVGLPSSPMVGDIIDIVTSQGGAAIALDPGSGTVNENSGIYVMCNGDQQRIICVNATGPEWSASSISILDFKNACVAAAFRTSNLSSTAGITSQKVTTPGTTVADLTTYTTRFLCGWAGDNMTLTVPDGLHPGQQHAFVLNNPQNGKSYNVVPDNFCDGAQVILTLPFDGVVLEWDTNCSKWFILSYSGATTVSNDI